MPELPEVETVRRDLATVLPGRRISKAEIFDAKLAQKPGITEEIIGKVFSLPQRQGKFLILPFTNPKKYLVLHLRMTGQIIYRGKETAFASGHPAKIQLDALPDKHTRMRIVLDDGGEVFFNDQRRFGTVELLTDVELKNRMAAFGTEPGSARWTFNLFDEVIGKRKAPIKAILLNQNLIFGLGNIYADEACFRATILPMRKADSLSHKEKMRLFDACLEVITESIECRGTSIRDFVDTAGTKGGFAEKLQVYQRKGKECLTCGSLIAKVTCAGRGTHFCPNCQK